MKKIMIVEDALHNINESIVTLREQGHDVRVCRTAKEGLQVLEAAGYALSGYGSGDDWVPDVVMTDMELPFGDEFHSVYEGVTKTPGHALVPHAGLVIAIKAVSFVKRVGILTDTNHHHGDPIQQMLDTVGPDREERCRREEKPVTLPILRVEARNSCIGWVNIETGEKADEADELARDPASPWRPRKDWAKLAQWLIKKL